METAFLWHMEKAHSNLKKHGITFEEAALVFRDTLSVTISDLVHSTEEERFVTIGRSRRNKILVVVHSEGRYTIRIISARVATRRERMKYEEGKF